MKPSIEELQEELHKREIVHAFITRQFYKNHQAENAETPEEWCEIMRQLISEAISSPYRDISLEDIHTCYKLTMMQIIRYNAGIEELFISALRGEIAKRVNPNN